jgi:hypothetical protein
MANEKTERIGDDQLVYGMPKHMVGISTQESVTKFKRAEAEYERMSQSKMKDSKGNYYWTVHPKPKACEKCQAMAGKEFMEEPERPHPNCKCEIKKHPKVISIYGALEGFYAQTTKNFVAGNAVEVEVRNVGLGFPGVYVYLDGTCVWSTGHLFPGVSRSKTLYKQGMYPIDWEVKLWSRGADACRVEYFIRG